MGLTLNKFHLPIASQCPKIAITEKQLIISQHFPTSSYFQATSKLFPKDLFEIFPSVTVRLLDAPLHEFFPSTEAGLAAVAAVGARVPASLERVKRRTAELREANPMLGCLVKS